jgi:hypothetical protein
MNGWVMAGARRSAAANLTSGVTTDLGQLTLCQLSVPRQMESDASARRIASFGRSGRSAVGWPSGAEG